MNTQPVLAFAFLPWLFWTIVTLGASYALSQLLQKNPKIDTPRPDQFKAPTIGEGTQYSIGFGTNWFEAPVVDWWGDFKADPIVKHYTVNKWFNNKRVYYVAGYHYSIGINMIYAQGVYDGFKQIKVGKKVVWPNIDDDTEWNTDGATSASIDEPNCFGGQDKGGGIVGTVRFRYGEATQSVSSYMSGVLSSNISAYRGLTSMVLEQVRFGTSPYMDTWKVLLKRTDVLTTGETQWYSSKAAINTYTLNAAHIIRECLTNPDWGMKIPESLLSDSVWEDVADTLYDEGFGLCMKWEGSSQTLKQFIQDVLRHIDAKLYQDPTTGKVVLKLIRDDYVESGLDVYSDDDIISVDEYGRDTIYEAINFVELEFWDLYRNDAVLLPDHNTGLMDMQGQKVIPLKEAYYGIVDADLAGTVVARQRQQISAFPASFKLRGKRTMHGLRPGSVFKMTWAPLGVSELVLRALNVNLGTLKDGTVTIECQTDIYANQPALFNSPPVSGWTPPHNDPEDVEDYVLMETTFWDVVQDAGISDALLLDADAGFLVCGANRPTQDAYGYDLLLRDSPTDSFNLNGAGNFTPNGLINADMPLNAQDVTLTLTDAQGLYDVVVGTKAVIDDEIVKVLSVTPSSNQVQVARGCVDTVPAFHGGPTSSGGAARIWFLGTLEYITGREYTTGDEPGVKFLTKTAYGALAEGDATVHSATAFSSRMNRPYPPGNFQINSLSYPASFSGQPTISWYHRDRTQQAQEIVEHSDSSIGPETSVTYTLYIYDEDNSLVRTESGLTSTYYTYQEVDEIADCGIGSGEPLNSKLRFVLKAVRGSYDSWQSYDLTVNRV